MKLIALDVGTKRIGLAKADTSVRIAIPCGAIEVDGSEFQQIASFARVYGTDFFVIGLPRNARGQETAQSRYVREFAKQLSQAISGAKIRFQDESLTSVMAEERLDKRGKKYRKGDIDAEAATIILQDFLESFVPPSANGAKPASGRAKERPGKRASKHPILNIFLSLLALGVFAAVGGYIYYRANRVAPEPVPQEPPVFRITFLPGETISSVKSKLVTQGYDATDVDAAFAATYDHPVLADKPVEASLEGYIYGETYEFYNDATVPEIITTTLDELYKVVTDNNLAEAYAAQGLNLYQGITMASMVQKESSDVANQPTVAQTFYNRLAVGMHLGSDVTTQYALDLVDPDRTIYTDNQSALQIDSPYNTRLYVGLPYGPICNPGAEALVNAAHPDGSSYLYFLTGDDGVTYYSETDVGHQINVRDHCGERCAVSL